MYRELISDTITSSHNDSHHIKIRVEMNNKVIYIAEDDLSKVNFTERFTAFMDKATQQMIQQVICSKK